MKKLANLKGVITLNKIQQKGILGGGGIVCLSSCDNCVHQCLGCITGGYVCKDNYE